MNTMTRKQMIEAIYEKIAKTKKYNDGDICSHCGYISHGESQWKIPVMIGDVLDWIYNNMGECGMNTCPKCGKRVFIEERGEEGVSGTDYNRCTDTWKCRWEERRNLYKREEIIKKIYSNFKLRKPIEEQSEFIIKFIFDNLNLGQQEK